MFILNISINQEVFQKNSFSFNFVSTKGIRCFGKILINFLPPKSLIFYNFCQGLNHKHDSPITLGNFTFNGDKTSIQTFKLSKSSSIPYQYVKFDFLKNNGHPEVTCVYRSSRSRFERIIQVNFFLYLLLCHIYFVSLAFAKFVKVRKNCE